MADTPSFPWYGAFRGLGQMWNHISTTVLSKQLTALKLHASPLSPSPQLWATTVSAVSTVLPLQGIVVMALLH